MVIIGKEYLGLDIWLETPNQDKGTEDMILQIWFKVAMKEKEINL